MENQSVAQKLEALVKLQSIDSKLDELKKLRGDLPDEVQDLVVLDALSGSELLSGGEIVSGLCDSGRFHEAARDFV